jgi:hypothetical protein
MPKTREEVTEEIYEELRAQFAWLGQADNSDIQQLLGHRDVKPAYDKIKARLNGVNKVPDHMRESGVTPDMWAYVQSVRSSRNEARAEHAATSKKLSEDYEVKVRAAKALLDTKLTATESPIVRIIEAGVDALPAPVIFRLNKIADKSERATRTAEALSEFRKHAIEQVYGEAPFSTANEAGRA